MPEAKVLVPYGMWMTVWEKAQILVEVTTGWLEGARGDLAGLGGLDANAMAMVRY
jgi:hypothetical protein